MERVISILANVLVKYDYPIAIITLTSDAVEYEIDDRINILHMSNSYNGGMFARINIIKQLYYSLKKIKPVVVIGFGEVFNPVSIITAKMNNLKVFISDRSNPLKKHRKRDEIARKLFYPLADGMIAQTELSKKKISDRRLNNNILILPNPLMEFKNFDIRPNKKAIITVGRLIPSKNQKELIDIFNEINMNDWKLYIVGDGPLKKEITHYISSLHLDGKVILVGKTDNIEKWLGKGSIFAFVSLSEGFPNALNEAMAFPLASIAYDCPAGVRDLIEDKYNGLLIPLGNHTEYRKKLKELMDSEDLRKKLMQNSITNRVKYDKNIISRKLLNFITE
ncbi:glycosyltransferase [Proteiniphilum acetatigenes]|uniref:glycosyltransferase n=1 Tax=Proteiniphilum acetatigenes TaxID=294710 RepID=UPI00039F0541|nr:glycosyltransferase [Proteiniphilum acetatigenes]